MNDLVFFVALPYVSVVLFLVLTIQRYRSHAFTYSSLSSQFLENKRHFWASVPFHYGILGVLALHLLAFLAPRSVLAWNAEPARLIALEVTGMALGVVTVIGLVNIFLRRMSHPRARRVTSLGDWLIYTLLLIQVVAGVAIAITLPWGSSWFAAVLSPWLWSLVRLNPDVSFVAPLPWLVKLHLVNAFLILAVFPFTRLVHVLVVPNPYLWRKPQVVLWNSARRPTTGTR